MVDKFSDDSQFNKLFEEKETIELPKNDYKQKVNRHIEEFENKYDFNLLNQPVEEPNIKKIQMSLYFNPDDLLLLKAVAYNNNTTVNKLIMNILEEPLRVTKQNLPKGFNIKSNAKKYDSKSCNKYKNNNL